MIKDLNIPAFIKKYKRKILLTIFLFWFTFALVILAGDEISSYIIHSKMDPVDRMQYCIRFVVWTLLTPLIIFLAIKFPIQRRTFIRDFIIHFLFALVILAIEFWIEIPIVRALTLNINGFVEPVAAYARVFFLKFSIYLLLYFLIAGITYLVLYMENNHKATILAKEADIKNQQLQTQLAEAKLNMLKMQLDPHFLFNTHHSIISLMLNNENDKAIKMLTMLSDLLRLSLDSHQQVVTLEQEIHFLKLYLDIQQIRFEDRLKVSFDTDPAAVLHKVPIFILQPLAENAIKYGAGTSSVPCNIFVESKLEGKQLVLSVTNNGSPVDFKNFHEGVGITNTRERLKQLYNGLSSFELRNLDNKTVVASLTFPIS